MDNRVLYAGDTSLTTAGAYLAGVMSNFAIPFDYLASDQPIGPALSRREYALYTLSDYPVNNWRDDDFAAVLNAVRSGAGLMMLGGWESFHGLGGLYHNSPLANALPVEMQNRDDRINCPQPCLMEKLRDHEIIAPLPMETPPTVGGYNLVKVKPAATQILSARQYGVVADPDGHCTFSRGSSAPLLVVGEFGRGRTAAFTSDAAPHWVGGFVDWGPDRVRSRAAGAEAIEVGSDYAEFFRRLILWTMGKTTSDK